MKFCIGKGRVKRVDREVGKVVDISLSKVEDYKVFFKVFLKISVLKCGFVVLVFEI